MIQKTKSHFAILDGLLNTTLEFTAKVSIRFCCFVQEVKEDVLDPKVTKQIALMVALLNLVYVVFLLPYGCVNIYELTTGMSAMSEVFF